jgi:hypothetical protein
MTTYNRANDPYVKGGELTVNRTSVALSASDTVDFPSYPKAVQLLTAGTVNALPLKNADASFVNFGSLLAGYILPFRVRRINATGTTATFVGLYD